MAAAPFRRLLAAAVLFLAVSSGLLAGSAADNPGECPYPCLPPPNGPGNLPPSPPSGPALFYPPPPPPPQPYTPGWLPPPSGYLPGYQPPAFSFPAPPPPNPIMPYFPYYFRNAAPLLAGGRLLYLGTALLSSIAVHLFFLRY